MRVRVRYTKEGSKTREGYIIGASPVQLGLLILQLDDKTTIQVDADYITEIEEIPL